VAAQAPREAFALIASVSVALRSAQNDARAARRGLVDLQAKISGHESAVATALDRLGIARSRIETSLLEPESPPLWRAFGDSGRSWERAAGLLASESEAARAYLSRPGSQLAGQLAAFAAAAWLGLRLRRRAARFRADPQLADSAVILERPFASAALVAFALAPLFHPSAPASVLALFRIALIVPVLRLLPALAPRELFPAILVAAALALMGELRAALASISPLERGLFASELAIAAATLAWFTRSPRLALIPDPQRIPRLLHRALRVALAALLAAMAGSAFGWSNLAHLIGSGTLRSAYAAIVLYSAARVVRAGLRAAALSDTVAQLRLFRVHGEAVQQSAARLVKLAAFALWAGLTLDGFGVWDAFTRIARGAWELQLAYGSLAISLGDVLTFALTLWVAWALARLLRFALEGDVLTNFEIRRGVAYAVARTAQYVVLLLGFFAAAAAASIDINRFAVLAGAFGVGIGFGLQNIVNNFVSGLILLYERPIQVGDSIEVGGVFGDVSRIGVRASTVRTWEGAEVIVPNATLISERVTNWTLSDRARRVDLPVGVAYGSNPHAVIELLLRCAREHRAVLAQPEPAALLLGFGDSALAFELRFWTYLDGFLPVTSEIALAVHDALAAAGIAIPFPQRDLHLRSVTPEAARAISATGPDETR
jgi:small-conductance mechanosensitive channel